MAMRDIGSRAPHLITMGRPKALGSRGSGRAGEPAVGESVRASGSLADVPHRPRLPSYPADRPRDLYESLSTLLGITYGFIGRCPLRRTGNAWATHQHWQICLETMAPERKAASAALAFNLEIREPLDSGAPR